MTDDNGSHEEVRSAVTVTRAAGDMIGEWLGVSMILGNFESALGDCFQTVLRINCGFGGWAVSSCSQ